MKQFLKKKQLMMVALVAALGMAVYLNYYLLEDPALSAGTWIKNNRTYHTTIGCHRFFR